MRGNGQHTHPINSLPFRLLMVPKTLSVLSMGFQGGSLEKWLYFFFFYRVLFKNKNSSSEPYFLTCATLLQYPHFGSMLSWSLFFTKLTFPFLCCLCGKLALRPYVNWTLVDYPLSCCLLSSSITCRNDRSGQAGWSSGPWGRRAKGIVLFAYWIGARIFYAISLTVHGP